MGPNFATVSACAPAGHAIGEATETILRGDAEVMLAGGSEAPVFEATVGAFAAMRALSRATTTREGASRPFDKGRDGFVIAEGGGDRSCSRSSDTPLAAGARILAEVLGYAATADAHHITSPSPGGYGAVRAARRALTKAGIDASARSTTSAPTPRARRRVTRPSSLAFNTLFGERAGRSAITAIKSPRSGTRSARPGRSRPWPRSRRCSDGIMPPTLNLHEPDPAMGALDLTPHEAKRRDLRIALVNAFGFGGQNSAIVVGRWEDR